MKSTPLIAAALLLSTVVVPHAVLAEPAAVTRGNDPITRAEAAVMLTRALNLQVEAAADGTPFADVASGDWSAAHAAAVRKAGLMVGDPGGFFRPQDPVTREELASLLSRATPTSETGGALATQDAGSLSTWADKAAVSVLERSLMRVRDGRFLPHERVSRQEMADALRQAFDDVEEQAVIDAIEGERVVINGVAYAAAPSLQRLLRESNREILSGAKVRLRAEDGQVVSLAELEIVQSGQPHASGEKEFSRHLVLDAGGTVLEGDLKIAGGHVTIAGLQVQGTTRIESGEAGTVAFENLKLGTVEVSKQGVQVMLGDGVRVGNLVLPSGVLPSAVIRGYDGILSHVDKINGSPNRQPSAPTPGTAPVNRAPEVSVPIGDQILESPVGTGLTLDLSTAFRDADGDALTFAAIPQSSGVARMTVNGNTLVISPLNAGTTDIVLTARDSRGGEATQTFRLTIRPASAVNEAPFVQAPIGSLTLTAGVSTPLAINLDDVFKDPEGKPLSYEYSVAQNGVVAHSLEGAVLTMRWLNAGTTLITVTAIDDADVRTDHSFTLEVLPPPAT